MRLRIGTALMAVLVCLFVADAGAVNVTYKGWSPPDSFCRDHTYGPYRWNCIKAQRVVYKIFPAATRQRAMMVSYCETGHTYNRFATNPTSGTAGLFQIHPGNHGTTWHWKGHGSLTINRYRLYEPWYNVRVAAYMAQGGYNWGQWAGVCQA